jgi:hypothetical protein
MMAVSMVLRVLVAAEDVPLFASWSVCGDPTADEEDGIGIVFAAGQFVGYQDFVRLHSIGSQPLLCAKK